MLNVSNRMSRPLIQSCCAIVATTLLSACSPSKEAPSQDGQDYDILVSGGSIYDGAGGPPIDADIAIKDDKIVGVGDFSQATALKTIDAKGMAVSPGFINVLSWANESLLIDGKAQSDIRQGVTLEVFGEGSSMGPLTPEMKTEMKDAQGDLKYDIDWTSLGEYLDHLASAGIATNVASFIGAATVRVHEIGYADRAPNAQEIERMQDLVRQSMREGALGVGAALIYAPGAYAKTGELVALASAAAEFGGGYSTHMRSEGATFTDAIEETIDIAGQSGAWAMIHHFKPAGKGNWEKRDEGVALMEAARAKGIDISANMYVYTAGATGLNATMPPWVQEGGQRAWIERLKDSAIRTRLIEEMRQEPVGWENYLHDVGGPDNILLMGLKNDALKPLIGKTLAEVAQMRGTGPEETIIDLVVEDNSRVDAAFFFMSEENVRENITWPYMMFCDDEGAYAAEGDFLKFNVHPRAYGNFARLLGKYVRDEKVISLSEAIRRLTTLPAQQLRLKNRGCLDAGCYADIAIFDPAAISDHATYEEPHRYSTGMRDVLVNGVIVLRDAQHTGELPGQIVRGPGYQAPSQK